MTYDYVHVCPVKAGGVSGRYLYTEWEHRHSSSGLLLGTAVAGPVSAYHTPPTDTSTYNTAVVTCTMYNKHAELPHSESVR